MYLDNPMSVAYEAAKTAHFGTHPLGNSILGTVESIKALEADQMRDYFSRRYSPSNIVLAFAGKADWSSLVELAGTHCGRWEGGVATRDARPFRGSASFNAILRAEDQQQTVVAVCSGPPLESPDRYAAHLLATILGDHTGSRLYWALIDPGLADGAELSYQDYNQAGSFFTFLSCDPEQTQANLGRIADLYRTAIGDGVTEDELSQAKNKVLARVGAAQRAADGASGIAGIPLDVPSSLHPGRRRARSVQSRHRERPAPAPARLAALAALDRLGGPDDRGPTARVTAACPGAPVTTTTSEPASSCGSSACCPSLTELVCNLGKRGDLVGVTHECDYPGDVRQLPHLTRSRIPGAASSAEIDALVAAQAGSLYELDESLLAELNPDLILTQEQCDVCAVNEATVRRAAQCLKSRAMVESVNPTTLAEVFSMFRTVGDLIGAVESADRLVDEFEKTAGEIKRRQSRRPGTGRATSRPRVLLLEWLDPPYCSGHWNPEIIEKAGGVEVLGADGAKSRRVTWDLVAASLPDVIIVLPAASTSIAPLQSSMRCARVASGPIWQR